MKQILLGGPANTVSISQADLALLSQTEKQLLRYEGLADFIYVE